MLLVADGQGLLDVQRSRLCRTWFREGKRQGKNGVNVICSWLRGYTLLKEWTIIIIIIIVSAANKRLFFGGHSRLARKTKTG